jgi:hypothetical protein
MQSFIPSPLHPAIVHFPIVFMILLPVAAFGALWAIRRGVPAIPAWRFPVLAAAVLSASAWLALETGEIDEHRAERIVGEQALETHEAAAKRFFALTLGALLVTSAGLVRGNLGRGARVAASAAALGLVIAGYQVGHSGGRIVYGSDTTRGLSSGAGQAAPAAEPAPASADEDE